MQAAQKADQQVKLVSKEGQTVVCSLKITQMSKMLESTLEDCEEVEEDVRLPIPHDYLKAIVEYCAHYSYDDSSLKKIPVPLPCNTLDDCDIDQF